MNTFIQLRGTNGVGKSTTVRQIIEHGGFRVYMLSLHGKEYPYTFDGKTLIAGRYDTRECGGLDGVIKDRTIMKDYIVRLLKQRNPQVFILDAVMYGNTFDFAYQLNRLCEGLGYHYIGISLSPPFEVCLQRVLERNGGKPIKVKNLQSKYRSSLIAYQKLKGIGVDIRLIDTSKIPESEMHKIIEDVL